MGGKKGTSSCLGRAIIKKQYQKHKSKKIEPGDEHKHTIDVLPDKGRIMSIIDQNSLDEFVQLAALSNKDFTADRYEVQVINRKEILSGSTESASAQLEMLGNFCIAESTVRNPKYTLLKIPRRPQWNDGMTTLEINTQENLAFLEWRRDIATIEENNVTLAITPFEKNLDVWKQLWRVVERSHVLLQIVDARNPYFFYSADLEKYIKEVDKNRGTKQFLLLINKADYLTEELREHWSKYFKQNNINHLFFSALLEQEKIDKLIDESDESEEDDGNQREEEEDVETQKLREIEEQKEAFVRVNTSYIFDRKELLALLAFKARVEQRTPDDRLVVGMVGYPNVGKSSVINVLCGSKRVGVAAMPGKTKHFQTLNLEGAGCWNLQLCDCPGLVFPSFANSKAEMMCCGVLPIDTMKDFISPVSLIVLRVPREVLEHHYHINLPSVESKSYSASVFLQVFGAKKGLVTGRGLPNEAIAARHVLKDYVNGGLLFCHLRPDYNKALHGDIQQSGFITKKKEEEVIPYHHHEEDHKSEDDGHEADQDSSDEDPMEMREEVKELGDTESHRTQPTNVTLNSGTSSKYKPDSAAEEDLDRDFFTIQQQT